MGPRRGDLERNMRIGFGAFLELLPGSSRTEGIVGFAMLVMAKRHGLDAPCAQKRRWRDDLRRSIETPRYAMSRTVLYVDLPQIFKGETPSMGGG
jgi:hypothetical protein